MARNYTRSYSKSVGQTIVASDFNSEFQAIDDAFNQATGHRHNGSTDEGSYIPLISDTNEYTSIVIDEPNDEIDFNINVGSAKVRQFYLQDGAILPDTDNDLDLGSASLEFKDLYIDGVAYIDTYDTTGASLGDVLTADGANGSSFSAPEIVYDLSPQLGANLALNSFGIPLDLNAQTGTSYTAVLTDGDKIITMNNAAANTFTIPANASVTYPVGTKLNILQIGAGATTVAINTDTLSYDTSLTLTLNGQYAMATAIKIAATQWVLVGNLAQA